MAMMSNKRVQAAEINELLLTLWDKAVGTSDYDKAQWQRLQELLNANYPPRKPSTAESKKQRN
jgi:hypothetical protein